MKAISRIFECLIVTISTVTFLNDQGLLDFDERPFLLCMRTKDLKKIVFEKINQNEQDKNHCIMNLYDTLNVLARYAYLYHGKVSVRLQKVGALYQIISVATKKEVWVP